MDISTGAARMDAPLPSAWTRIESQSATIVPAVWDLKTAQAAEEAGASALFLTGANVASSFFGFPDKGLVSLTEFVDIARRIARETTIPLMVDGDTGFGHLGLAARLADLLVDAGVAGVMIEDQEQPGQSIAANPGLCSAELMVRRLEVIRAVAGSDLAILARTDIVGKDWDFDETLRRVGLYLGAGANWVLANFLRSSDELKEVANLSRGRSFAMNVHGVGGYMPTVAEARNLGLKGIFLTGQQHPISEAMKQVYRQTVAGEDFGTKGAWWEANHEAEVALNEGDVPSIFARRP
jgi:2-methylisocitrate lyase-like PEP mutase family enzyme